MLLNIIYSKIRLKDKKKINSNYLCFKLIFHPNFQVFFKQTIGSNQRNTESKEISLEHFYFKSYQMYSNPVGIEGREAKRTIKVQLRMKYDIKFIIKSPMVKYN